MLCLQMAVDLVDTIAIIDVVFDEKEYNYGIPLNTQSEGLC